jgi:hypothetical protein
MISDPKELGIELVFYIEKRKKNGERENVINVMLC